MALSQPNEPAVPAASQGFALFALGFRPFFLLAGIAAVLLVPLWAAVYGSGWQPSPYFVRIPWHAHEMLFGYTVAVIAGFLLTAVRNWTSVETPSGTPLALLALLWLVGRLMPYTALPGPLIAGVDLAFLPALGIAIGIPLFKAKQRHNGVFVVLLGVLTTANLLLHLAALGYAHSWRVGIDLAVGTIVLLISIMGGRVVPFFIERGLPGAHPRQWPWLERLAIVAAAGWMLGRLLLPGTVWLVGLAAFAALVFGFRVAAWYVRGIGSVPLLWVLWLGFAWLVAGFALDACAAAGLLPPSLALHAFTLGGIGGLTLGMMARVALGHTGRPMRSAAVIGVAFGLINVAAAVRVFGPLVLPSAYTGWVHTAALLWGLAFAAFLVVYAPILSRPRVDGRPG